MLYTTCEIYVLCIAVFFTFLFHYQSVETYELNIMFLSLHHTQLPIFLGDKVINNATAKTFSRRSNLFNILLTHNSPLMIHFAILQRFSSHIFPKISKHFFNTINPSPPSLAVLRTCQVFVTNHFHFCSHFYSIWLIVLKQGLKKL